MHAFLTGLTYLYVAVLLTVVGGLFTVTLDAVLRGLYDVTVTVLNVTVVGGFVAVLHAVVCCESHFRLHTPSPSPGSCTPIAYSRRWIRRSPPCLL